MAQLWAAHWQARSKQTRAALIEHYRPLIRVAASRSIARAHKHADDILQDGVFGLADAIDKFDPARGRPFEIYATVRIRGAILDAQRSQDWLPRGVRRAEAEADSDLAALASIDEVTGEGVEPEAECVDPDDAVYLDEVTPVLAAAINGLPYRARFFVSLYFFRRMTLLQLGDHFGITESGALLALRSSVDRVRRQVRAKVDPAGP